MTTVIGYHEIDDSAHWLASTKRKELGDAMGLTFRTFLDPTNSNRAAVLIDMPDGMSMGDLQAFLQSEEAAAAMKHDGVRPETLVVLVEA